MNKINFTLLTTLVLFTYGCHTNNHSYLGDPSHLPSDWTLMSAKSWQVKNLNAEDRELLAQFKEQIVKEQQGQYFNFYGEYSPAFRQVIQSTTSRLDTAYLNLAYSSRAILSDLTPQMNGLSETYDENDAGIAVVNNANERMYDDDWRRALLLDKPSMLSPVPVVQD